MKVISLVLIIWYSINAIVFHNYISEQYIYYTVLTGFTMPIMACITVDDFRQKWRKVIQWLSFVSIIVHSLYWLNIIKAHIFQRRWDMCYGIFNVGWGDEDRLASIFWEPGQYQIILMSTFLLCITDVVDLMRTKDNILLVKRYGVLVVALFMTQSTTGYITFALYGVIISFMFLDKKHISSGLLLLIGMSITAYFLYNSETVQKKLGVDDSQQEHISYTIRMADNLANLTMTLEEPITGYGIYTKEYKHRSLSLDNQTSSNGWLRCGAQMGLLFLLFYLFCIWAGCRKFGLNKCWPVFVMFLISQAGEPEYYYPIVLLFIYDFKETKNIRTVTTHH